MPGGHHNMRNCIKELQHFGRLRITGLGLFLAFGVEMFHKLDNDLPTQFTIDSSFE